MKFGTVPTEFGDMTLVWNSDGLCYLGFDEGRALGFFGCADMERNTATAKEKAGQVFSVWRGEENILDLPLVLEGTAFQKSVWQALLEIPKGQVTTYQAIADKIGKPKAVRAVGSAVGANPLSLLIPCHRVIRKDGSLGGYLWGLDLKKKILNAEGAVF